MKICFVTAVWKRPEIFALFADNMQRLKAHFSAKDIDISFAVAGSEGQRSQWMVEKAGGQYIETDNKKLGKKWNLATKCAEKEIRPDWFIFLGSDDLIPIKTLEFYIERMNEGYDYICMLDTYFFDTISKKALVWNGYNNTMNSMPSGVGKAVRRDAMEKAMFEPFIQGRYDTILDTGFDKKMLPIFKKPLAIRLRQNNLFALDIKSSMNMTPFELWDNCEWLDAKEMLETYLPKDQAKLIYDTN
jgi:hypothetical protein